MSTLVDMVDSARDSPSKKWRCDAIGHDGLRDGRAAGQQARVCHERRRMRSA